MPSPSRPPLRAADDQPTTNVARSSVAIPDEYWVELARQQRETARRKQDGLPTAQDLYKLMLNTRISPAMRALGFKGSGGHYYAPSPTRWSVVDLQRSAYSDAFEILFTANLLSADRNQFPKRPTADGNGERLGFMTPHQSDYWWKFSVESDLDEVAEDFISAIRDFGLKWILAQP